MLQKIIISVFAIVASIAPLAPAARSLLAITGSASAIRDLDDPQSNLNATEDSEDTNSPDATSGSHDLSDEPDPSLPPNEVAETPTPHLDDDEVEDSEEPEIPEDPDATDSPETPPLEDPAPDDPSTASTLYLKAINPGYVKNAGELIEIGRTLADAPISLAGTTVSYTNSSGNTSVLLEFPENSWMIGENLLLRLASAPDSTEANEVYTKTLAMGGGTITLKKGELVLDQICWAAKDDDCAKPFTSAHPTTLVRNLETGAFVHEETYLPTFHPENYYLEELPPVETDPDAPPEDEDLSSDPPPNSPGASAPGLLSRCQGVEFSEILSYYAESQSEQFIELYNSTGEPKLLDSCLLRYKNNLYPISGVLAPGTYLAYYPEDFALTKNPNTSNLLELLDAGGTVLDELLYYKGQLKGTSYAWTGYDASGAKLWQQTYAPTPSAPNQYQEFKSCPEGKIINPETGNCINPPVTKITVCPDGYELNPDTGRCNKIKETKTTTCSDGYYLNPVTNRCNKIKETKVTICKEGYYLNPLTNRCNKVKEATTASACQEGYERNPETGRCRKIKQNSGADYALEPETHTEQSQFVAVYAVVGVLGVGLAYFIWEFRHDISKLARRVFHRR